MKTWSTALVVSAGVAALIACSGAPNGADVSKVEQGLNGPGDDCSADPGTDDFISTRATQGLAITPVALNLSGKSDTEIQNIGYGSYLVNAVASCTDCHTNPATPTLFLAGGRAFTLTGPVPNGTATGPTVRARNLTPDSATGLQLTEDQFIEAIRTGRDFRDSSTRLAVMPWPGLRWLSIGDLKAIYAYLRAIPPVTNSFPADTKDTLGLPPSVPFPDVYSDGDETRRVDSDPACPSPNYPRGRSISPLAEPDHLGNNTRLFGRGSYLVNLAGCNDCHTHRTTDDILTLREGRDPLTLKLQTESFLSGGRFFNSNPAVRASIKEDRALSADLTGAQHGFFHEADATPELFIQIIRTGTHADENPARPLAFPMPWTTFKNMVDEDLQAIFIYASLIPARTSAPDKDIQNWARFCKTNADCHPGETCFVNPATGNVAECIGGACSSDADCNTCQSCVSGACQPPNATNFCLTHGQ